MPDPSDVQVEAMAEVLWGLDSHPFAQPWPPGDEEDAGRAEGYRAHAHVLLRAIADGEVPGIAQVGDDEVVLRKGQVALEDGTVWEHTGWTGWDTPTPTFRPAPPAAPKGDGE